VVVLRGWLDEDEFMSGLAMPIGNAAFVLAISPIFWIFDESRPCSHSSPATVEAAPAFPEI
jgi:hypothetical protein